MKYALYLLLSTCVLTGCVTAYRWTSGVPERMRTVSVPTFRNESEVTELGSVMARQLLREVQREGTFKVRRSDDAALEIQGTVKSATSTYGGGDRRAGSRLGVCALVVIADISVVDRANGKVLIDNRRYTGQTTFVINQDRLTGERNASGRAAEDIAQQVVDDLTAMSF